MDCSEDFLLITCSQSQSTISRGEDSAASKDAGQLDLRDKQYSSYCIERRVLPRQMADKGWKRPKGFRVNFTQPKVGSQSWSPNFS